MVFYLYWYGLHRTETHGDILVVLFGYGLELVDIRHAMIVIAYPSLQGGWGAEVVDSSWKRISTMFISFSVRISEGSLCNLSKEFRY